MMDSEDKKIDIEGVDPRELYGPQNIYLEQMQELHPNLKIIARGSALTVLGPRSDSERFRKRLDGLIAYYLKYGYISKESVQQAFSTGVIEHDAPVDKDVIVYGNNGTIVRARTVNQLKLVQSYDRNDLLLAIGPAGSGKTYTAIALAVRALKEKHVKRIILTRPAVEAGEKLGFLPGDMKEKLDPYLQPLYDALNDMIPPAKKNTSRRGPCRSRLWLICAAVRSTTLSSFWTRRRIRPCRRSRCSLRAWDVMPNSSSRAT